jgi:hypothetical protein
MTTMRTTFLILFTLTAAAAFGDCKPNLSARSTTYIAIGNITDDCNFGTPAPGDTASIKAADSTIAAMVVKFHPGKTVGTVQLPATLEVASTDSAPEKLRLINNEGSVSVTVNGNKADAKVLTTSPNYLRYDWSVGPATSGDANGGSSSSSSTTNGTDTAGSNNSSSKASSGAIRLKYNGAYASSGMLGTPVGSAQTTATVNIDTTDQKDTSFIDNNRGTLGFRWNLPSVSNILKQGAFGFDGRVSKAAHHDIHDIDGAVTFSGWLPVIHNLNLLNRGGEFISTPLSLTASYGYRNRHMQGDQFHGKVFEATALYHVFAVDRYKVDFDATWTVNELSNRPATTPHTQRLYKATVSYLADPAKGFSMVTSFEDGSAGVMLTKVRQYFVGLALSKLNFTGSSK